MNIPKTTSISVIIPTHDRFRLLLVCVKSLLNQTLLPKEIIIIDTSTNNRLKKYLKNLVKKTKIPKIVIINKKNAGWSTARNSGIQKAKSKILSFIDDDCTANKNWIENIKIGFENNSKKVIVGKNITNNTKNISSILDDIRARTGHEPKLLTKKYKNQSLTIDTKNFAIKRELLIKNNLFFDSRFDFLRCEDHDFAIRIINQKIRITYNEKMQIFHKPTKKLTYLLKKEFNNGKAKYHLNKKWPQSNDLYSLKFGSFYFFLSVHNEYNISFFKKGILVFLILFCSIIYRLGEKFEHFRNEINFHI